MPLVAVEQLLVFVASVLIAITQYAPASFSIKGLVVVGDCGVFGGVYFMVSLCGILFSAF